MAKDKKSFLLYCDIIYTVNKLTNEQAGNLFKHILSYVNDENPTTENIITELTFEPIKQALKRDLIKYETILQKRSEAGKKSSEAKKNNLTSVENTHTNLTSVENTHTNLTSVESVQQSSTNSTVIDSVIVSDIVIDSVIEINYKNKLLSEIKISDVRESDLEYYNIAKNFYELFKLNLIELGSKTNQIEKTKASWIDDLRLIIEKDNYTIDDLRKVYNFLKIEKPSDNGFSWKKNILSISKLREQMTKLLIESKKINSLPIAMEELKKMHDSTNIDSEKRKCNQLASVLQDTKILKNKPLNFNIKYFIEQTYGMYNIEGGRIYKELLKRFLANEENMTTKQILTEIKNYYV